jgi:hypothetical protein
MARAPIILYADRNGRDAFGRNVGWITGEVLEECAGAMLRIGPHLDYCIAKWAEGDLDKDRTLRAIISELQNSAIRELQNELMDEYGEAAFIGRPKSVERLAIELEIDYKAAPLQFKAAIMAQIIELRGLKQKPVEKTVTVTNNIASATTPTQLSSDPREAERVVMSILGSL